MFCVLLIGSVILKTASAQGGYFYYTKVCQLIDDQGNATQVGSRCIMGYHQCAPNPCGEGLSGL